MRFQIWNIFHIVAILIKPTVNSEFKIQSLFSIYRSSGGTGSSERKHDVLAGEVSGSLDVNLEVSIVSVGEVGEEILLEWVGSLNSSCRSGGGISFELSVDLQQIFKFDDSTGGLNGLLSSYGIHDSAGICSGVDGWITVHGVSIVWRIKLGGCQGSWEETQKMQPKNANYSTKNNFLWIGVSL